MDHASAYDLNSGDQICVYLQHDRQEAHMRRFQPRRSVCVCCRQVWRRHRGQHGERGFSPDAGALLQHCQLHGRVPRRSVFDMCPVLQLLLCTCTAQYALETFSELCVHTWSASRGWSLAAGKYLATADRDNKVRVSILPADPLKVGNVNPATVPTRSDRHIVVMCGWI